MWPDERIIGLVEKEFVPVRAQRVLRTHFYSKAEPYEQTKGLGPKRRGSSSMTTDHSAL